MTAFAEPAQLVRASYFSEVVAKERDYYIYLPAGFEARDSWPVMLFLHGNGERGDGKEDLDWVTVHGPLYEAWVQKRDLPFVIIAPQLPMYDQASAPYVESRDASNIPQRLDEGVPTRPPRFDSQQEMNGALSADPDGMGPMGPPSGWPLHAKELIQIIDAVLTSYRGDPKRVYLSGLSYGGFGTWYMASKYPQKFAAINPIVGFAHPDWIDSIAAHKIPVWCFAGGRDEAVPVRFFYAGMNKLEELGHKNIRFTVEEDMNHDVWSRVYAGEDIYNWLLSHSK